MVVSAVPAHGDSRRVVLQSTSSDCGPAALATLLTHYHRIVTTEREIMRLTGVDKQTGTSLSALREAAAVKGCSAQTFRMSFELLAEQIAGFGQPVIVRTLNPEPHFSLCLGTKGDLVYLSDPAVGNVAIGKAAFLRRWLPAGSSEGYVFVVAGPQAEHAASVRKWVMNEIERQQWRARTWRPAAQFRR
jgi:predicted double-glycine peptidase